MSCPGRGAGGSLVRRQTIVVALAYQMLMDLRARLNDAACASVRPAGLCSWKSDIQSQKTATRFPAPAGGSVRLLSSLSCPLPSIVK